MWSSMVSTCVCPTACRARAKQNRYLTLRGLRNLCVKNIAGGDARPHASACLPVSPPPFMAGIAEVEVDKATGNRQR